MGKNINDILTTNKQKIMVVITVLLLLTAVGLFSYAFSYDINYVGLNTNKIESCTLDVSFKETGQIQLLSSYPMDYAEVQLEEPYTFYVKSNNGTCDNIAYTISMANICDTCENTTCSDGNGNTCKCDSNHKLDESLISYELKNVTTGKVIRGDGINNLKQSFTLDDGDTNTFEMKIWINENATNNDLYYNGNQSDPKTYCGKLNVNMNSVSTIPELYNSGKLHIGDFITYDAGTWTASEIASIQVGPNDGLVSASGSTSLPSTAYQFGGFTTGQSRNVGAMERDNGNYMYAKMYDGNDSSNQVPLSGWRIFDIDEDNETVTLISAANPEDYYLSAKTNSAYISQYILTRTKDSSWTDDESNYTIRNWSMYENSAYNASNARILTKTDLDNWYNKYTESTFQRIYSSPYLSYQNLIDNHSWYLLGSAYGGYYLFAVIPSRRDVLGGSGIALGVRVLVSIPLTSTIQENPVARRTVTLDGMEWLDGTYGAESVQEYNVWDLVIE